MAVSAQTGFNRLLANIAKPRPSVAATTPLVIAPAPARTTLLSADANGATVVASLMKGTAFTAIAPADWQALGSYLASLSAAQQMKASLDMGLRGLSVVVQADNQEVTLLSEKAQASVDLRTHELRLSAGGDAEVFKDGQPLETVQLRPDGKLAVQQGDQVQVWDPDTGKGTQANGADLPVRYAERVPGEAKRKPWAQQPASKLVEPNPEDISRSNFARLYNAAVVKAGGEVLEPLSLETPDPMRYNCHAYATTGSRGDLLDPFDSNEQPRWLNMPTFQLANGPFKRLAPDQKVHVGDVILYEDSEGTPTHTGRVTAVDADGNPSAVKSKWGAYGLYQHAPSDVPAIYGHIASFYRPDAPRTAR